MLPKGGVDPGEDLETAARREIAEESGIIELSALGPLGILARRNFKKTYWQTSYYGLYTTEQIIGEATDPDNYGMAWFSMEALPAMCWPDERRLIDLNRQRIDKRVRTAGK